jgi:DNA-binding IclR family transcriptional regulator
MSEPEEPKNIVLVRLDQLMAKFDKMQSEMRENFVRLGNQVNALEGSMGLVLHYAGDRAQIDASVNQRFDAIQQKIQQLEDMIDQMKQI